MAIWYTAASPSEITLALSDGTVVGPVGPPSTPPYRYQATPDLSVTVTKYTPGYEFYPATSTSGDRFVNIYMSGHGPATGTITIQQRIPDTYLDPLRNVASVR